MKHINLTAIRPDSATQVRAEISQETVVAYAQKMEEGEVFPPIDLFRDGDEFLIGDGWHRFLAAQKNGDVTMQANVFEGGRSAAIKHALSANARHGLPRSNADKRRSVEVALTEFGNLSDRELAKICAVGHPFVGKIRSEQLESNSSSSTESRLGADGKIRKVPATTMRHEPRGESEQTVAVEQAPPIGGPLSEIESDAKRASKPNIAQPRTSYANQYATMAIVALEKIQPSDPERSAQLNRVINWINEHR